MKIKDLPPDKPLGHVAFLHPVTGARCYWISQWPKGVWYKKDLTSTEVFIIDVEKLTDALEFEIAP